ncbi:MAG TPA: nucleotidyltransferase domain-containing protein [Kofleriaceae bacterium]|nr:nucleotidyltransferase domain-containing protein [Kofleriaceae bacterium]
MSEIDRYHELAHGVAAALSVPGLRSVYLIGSLARGSFAPGISDIDLLAFADGAETATLELWRRETLISLCIRPVEHLYDPFGPLRWSGRKEPRTLKELTAVSDAMFLCDHGVLLRGGEVRPLCVLPTRRQYRAYLRWESELAARGPLRHGIIDNPRRAAKRIATWIRDLRFLQEGHLGSHPAELLAFIQPRVSDHLFTTVMAALWLSSLPSQDDYTSPLAGHAIDRVMWYREQIFSVCADIAHGPDRGTPDGWAQLADLHTERFTLCGKGDEFAQARPIVDVPIGARR